jgi:hypothetical protein
MFGLKSKGKHTFIIIKKANLVMDEENCSNNYANYTLMIGPYVTSFLLQLPYN